MSDWRVRPDGSYDPFALASYAARKAMWERKERPYRPLPHQDAFHQEMHYPIKACGGGLGSGKTFSVVHDWCHEILIAPYRATMPWQTDDGQWVTGFAGEDGYNGRVGITGNSYKAPQTVFNYLMQILRPLGLLAEEPTTPAVRNWRAVTTTGVEIVTVSSANPADFASKPYTVVHMTEVMQQPVEMFDAATERLSRWPGPFPGKLYLDGTFEDIPENVWFIEVAQRWLTTPNEEHAKYYKFPSWLNTYDFPGGFTGDKIQAAYKHYEKRQRLDLFDTRYGGKLPKLSGTLWGDYLDYETHVGRTPHDPAFDPNFPVDLAIDPATHRYAVVFLQRVPGVGDTPEVRVIDEVVIENASWEKVRAAVMETPYWTAGNIGKFSEVVPDHAATQRHQGMPAHIEQIQAPVERGGLGLRTRSKKITVLDGMAAMKTALEGELYDFRINPRCEQFLSDLRQERRDKHGIVNAGLNKGHDDVRKAVSYWLHEIMGVVAKKPPRVGPADIAHGAGYGGTIRSQFSPVSGGRIHGGVRW